MALRHIVLVLVQGGQVGLVVLGGGHHVLRHLTLLLIAARHQDVVVSRSRVNGGAVDGRILVGVARFHNTRGTGGTRHVNIVVGGSMVGGVGGRMASGDRVGGSRVGRIGGSGVGRIGGSWVGRRVMVRVASSYNTRCA